MRVKRALIKMSGEALAGPGGAGIHGGTLGAIARDIAQAANIDYQE